MSSHSEVLMATQVGHPLPADALVR
ncbi:MAG: hypothetical protein QOG57_6130, partial [Pseudonocardiales bacterium]|nr:hypothetical protein [Pseudonocardiales bacterium]